MIALIAANLSVASPEPRFDVAAVKRAPSGTSITMSVHPGYYSITAPLRDLIAQAWQTTADCVEGPDWVQTELYSITAKAKPGIPADQISLMLQNLLAERFGLKVHHRTKNFDGYDLIIAKGGPKLKASLPSSPFGSQGRPGPDGLIIAYSHTTMQSFAADLGRKLRNEVAVPGGTNFGPGGPAPVIDKTGLNGNYDIVLSYKPRSTDPGDDLAGAVERELGLRLRPRKIPQDVIVVDYANKIPTEQ